MRSPDIHFIRLFVMLSLFMNSCTIVGGIFKTGMGVGIFLAIVVVAAIIFLITRSTKK